MQAAQLPLLQQGCKLLQLGQISSILEMVPGKFQIADKVTNFFKQKTTLSITRNTCKLLCPHLLALATKKELPLLGLFLSNIHICRYYKAEKPQDKPEETIPPLRQF